MSKTIRRIVSSLLIVAAFATIEPANYINIISSKAYASTFSSSDHALLSSLDTDKGSFNFSKTSSTATGKVSSSVEEVTLKAEAADDSYKITIDGNTHTGSGEETLDLDKGRNTFKVKVEDPSNSKTSVTYYVYITRGSSSSSSSDDDNSDNVYLNNITVDGSGISFSDTTNSYNVEVSDSTDEVRIKAEPENDDDTVKINGDTVDEDNNYKKWVSLDKGKNVVKIKVEDDNGNDRTYTLNIYRGEKAPSTTVATGEVDDTQDSIYLDDLSLLDAGTNIDFKRKVSVYEVNVKDDCDNLIVKAEPEDSDDIVYVNDNKVEDVNNNKRVYLQKGSNEIKVKVTNDYDQSDDDYEKRVYTIVVNRGTTASSTTNTNTTSTSNSTTKANQWVKNNYGQWTYYDGLGKLLTNSWYYDRNYGKWYRFGYDGSMLTGWQYDNGNAYYLNEDGSMQIGWKFMNGYWYYFNTDGSMKTGWLNDNGKWYYFYPSGGMASNVRIDGYKLGSDGAMI